MLFDVESFSKKAPPFLKWAGGKGKLIEQIDYYLPIELKLGKISQYVEPFVGGGAVLFHIAQNYHVERFLICDFNEELILVYRTVQQDVDSLVKKLAKIESQYFQLSWEGQKKFFYEVRSQFNASHSTTDFTKFSADWIERAAQFIFLNRTCFNGLFRVNSKSEFNVPFGRYKKPKICFKHNLFQISKILQATDIRYGDFTSCENGIDSESFVYFDPPYRPISQTSSFTQYSKSDFDDDSQIRLASFFQKLDQKGAKLMLSNSDPKNTNPRDRFFEHAYAGYRIECVKANRMINSDAQKRGKINELLIMNYSQL